MKRASIQKQQLQEMRAHVAQGDARFKAYCQHAGVKIQRTVEDVRGIYLVKVRTSLTNNSSQYLMDDPYGTDSLGDHYIKLFLIGRDKNGKLDDGAEDLPGYRFVETTDPKSGVLHRYTAKIERPGLTDPHYIKNYVRFVLNEQAIERRTARYAVDFNDLSTHEDRDYWIAGSSLQVIDLDTNEVLGERIGYMMDYGQGPDGGSRQAWRYAANNACPAFPGKPADTTYQTRNFVEQILHISK
jgi:hypothetical protein